MSLNDEVSNVVKPFILSHEQLIEIRNRVTKAMVMGLNPETKSQSSLKMISTYVRSLPTGAEKGKFLALDLGGTNFRVLMIVLDGNHENCQMLSKIYAIDKKQMTGPSSELFDYIAACLESFIKTHKVDTLRLPLGFTFSFPCDQLALTSALLIRWTKGFQAPGAEGEDVVRLLEDALIRRGVSNIEVTAILNDTTGTLMACAFHCQSCLIGLILGTGTNACYVENMDNVLSWTGPRDEGPNQVIINIEWGAFGDVGELEFISTEFDEDIDQRSLNPKQQLFEKMISGMYLGEIMRVALVSLVKKKLLFNGIMSQSLQEPYEFATKHVSEIENDLAGTDERIKEIFLELGIKNISLEDLVIIRFVAKAVSERAAYLSAAAVAALLLKIGKKFVTVAVDGSLYRFHPRFKSLMEHKITELVPPEYKFELMLSEDGSGRGAALVAAVASQELRRRLSGSS